MTTEIQFRNTSHRSSPYGGGKLVRQWEARLGDITRTAPTKPQAKAELMEALAEQAEHCYTRSYLQRGDVVFALCYADGWRYDIVRSGRVTSSTLLGDVDKTEAYLSMERHFQQYMEAVA